MKVPDGIKDPKRAYASLFFAFNNKKRFRTAGILVAVVAELIFFQQSFFRHWPFQSSAIDSETVSVYPFDYQPSRGATENLNPRMTKAYELIRQGNASLAIEGYSFLLFDSCLPRKFQVFLWSKPVWRLLSTAFPFFLTSVGSNSFFNDPKAPFFFETFGCSRPKLRLLQHAYIAKDPQDAELAAQKIPYLAIVPVLEGPHPPGFWDLEPGAKPGTIQVEKFSFNELTVKVEVLNSQGTWLYYADSYDPGWKAFVDGKSVPVWIANLGFKAVQVEAGNHQVRFYYAGRPLQRFSSNAIAVTAGIFGLFVLLTLSGQMLSGFFHRRLRKQIPV